MPNAHCSLPRKDPLAPERDNTELDAVGTESAKGDAASHTLLAPPEAKVEGWFDKLTSKYGIWVTGVFGLIVAVVAGSYVLRVGELNADATRSKNTSVGPGSNGVTITSNNQAGGQVAQTIVNNNNVENNGPAKRSLRPEDIDALKRVLSPFTRDSFSMRYRTTDTDGYGFTNSLRTALEGAGWTCVQVIPSMSFGPPLRGVEVHNAPPSRGADAVIEFIRGLDLDARPNSQPVVVDGKIIPVVFIDVGSAKN